MVVRAARKVSLRKVPQGSEGTGKRSGEKVHAGDEEKRKWREYMEIRKGRIRFRADRGLVKEGEGRKGK